MNCEVVHEARLEDVQHFAHHFRVMGESVLVGCQLVYTM